MKLWAAWILCMGITANSVLAGSLSADFLEAHKVRLDRLFEELDPDHSAMAPIQTDWQTGKLTDAAEALINYFESKPFNNELLEPLYLPPEPETHAEAALDHAVFLLGNWEDIPMRPDGGLDWDFHGERDDKESAWMLNRHSFFPSLAQVYKESGDPRYREQLNALWQDWILNSPYPSRLTFSPQWRPLEVARRVLNVWAHLFFQEDLLDPETRLLVLSSLVDHGDALRHHASFWGGNHLITEKLALLTVTTAWPEFQHSAEWQAYAIEKVSRQLIEQTYPDGSYKELSNHYQLVVLRNVQYFLRLLAATDPGFRQRPVFSRIEKMWDFFAGVMGPDGKGPLNNDSDLEYNAGPVIDNWEFYDRPDWLAIATHGARGILPRGSASRFYPWAGQVFLRNHWGPNADYIYFDAGPFGTAHQHFDRLHISATLGGQPVLADSGRYTYQPGQLRDYFSGPDGHSVLLIDGRHAEQGPRHIRKPMPVVFEEGQGVAFTAAVASFPSVQRQVPFPSMNAPVRWTRAIAYDQRGFALIIDHLVSFNRHEIEAIWNFHPEVDPDMAPEFLRLASPEGTLGTTISEGSEKMQAGGFYSPDYNQKEPAPLLRLSGQLDGPTTFVWVLQSPGEKPIQVKVLSKPGAPILHLKLFQSGQPPTEARIRLHREPALLQYGPG